MPVTKSVVVAGGAGYIGSHVCKALAREGFAPVVIDSFVSGHRHNVKWGPAHDCDIRDRAGLTRILKDARPAAIMHFAASIEVGIGEKNPTAFYDNNVGGTLSLLSAAQEARIGAFVFSSSCAVYGNAPQPLKESLPRAPYSVYGRTKTMSEEMLEDAARVHGLRLAILRYFNACGADKEGELGEEHDPETHLIPNVLKAAAENTPVSIFGTDYPTPDGTCLRDYVHVSDLADAHVAAMRKLLAGMSEPSAFNLGTGRPYSVREIIEAAKRVTKRNIRIIESPRRAGDVAVLTADVTKAKSLLGFAPRHSDLDTVIGTAWAFHRRAWKV